MKKILIILITLVSMTYNTQAQTAKEILKKYTEKTGGQKQWDKVVSMEITGKVKILAQNMNLPFLRIRMKDGRQYTSLDINGMSYISAAFDGKKAWGSNSQMKLEEKDSSELERVIREIKEFPYPTHNWAQKGFKAELLGKDTIDGTEAFKIKLFKDSVIVDHEKTENINILYIDTKNYFLILTETPVTEGSNIGQTMKAYMSEYKEIQGYWYPFFSELKYEEETFQIFLTEKVKFNSEIDENIFEMPPANK